MQWLVDCDAAYLVLPKAQSWIADCFRLADKPSKSKHCTGNGAILVEWYPLENLDTSAAEVETKGVFYSAKISISIHCILIVIKNPQDPAPNVTGKTNAAGFVNNNMVMKK